MTRPLPIYFGEPIFSCFGTMLFPNDELRAEGFVALSLIGPGLGNPGALARARERGFRWSEREQQRHEDVLGANLLSDGEIRAAWMEGAHVGAVVEALWAMICDDPATASLIRAINWVHDRAVAKNTAASTANKRLTAFASVGHLWGMWSIRRSSIGTVDEPISELRRFVGEADLLMSKLHEWGDSIPHYLHNGMRLLEVEKYGLPWSEVHATIPRLSLSKSA